jgi:hypothetical protein
MIEMNMRMADETAFRTNSHFLHLLPVVNSSVVSNRMLFQEISKYFKEHTIYFINF